MSDEKDIKDNLPKKSIPKKKVAPKMYSALEYARIAAFPSSWVFVVERKYDKQEEFTLQEWYSIMVDDKVHDESDSIKQRITL